MRRSDLPQPVFLTVPEAARLCGVSRNTVYSWVRKEKLPAYKTPGRTNLIRPSALVQFMHENGMFVPPALADMAQRDEMMNAPDAKAHEKKRTGSVLIVEEDPKSRALAFQTFHGSCVIYEAETGYEALHMLTVHKDITLVLFDLDVSGQYGEDTLAEMGRLRPNLGVIVAKDKDRKISTEALPRQMKVEILEKPISLGTLKTAISTLRAGLTVIDHPATSD
jgi:excisionase family DNA binding protein